MAIINLFRKDYAIHVS